MASYFVTIWLPSAWLGLAGVAAASGAFFLANHPDRILILVPADADFFLVYLGSYKVVSCVFYKVC